MGIGFSSGGRRAYGSYLLGCRKTAGPNPYFSASIIPLMTEPHDSYETKARALRALYRDNAPRSKTTPAGHVILSQADQRRQWELVSAEYERLFGARSTDGSLEKIITNAWTEGRELAGQRYDYQQQCWLDADGKRVWD